MENRSGMKLVLRSPVFRLAEIEKGGQELQMMQQLIPMTQADPEVGMVFDYRNGLQKTLAKMDFPPEWIVSKEEFEKRVAAQRQAEMAQQQADVARTAAQAFQASARGAASLQDSGMEGNYLRGLIERG